MGSALSEALAVAWVQRGSQAAAGSAASGTPCRAFAEVAWFVAGGERP
jgi:hypothetical protein